MTTPYQTRTSYRRTFYEFLSISRTIDERCFEVAGLIEYGGLSLRYESYLLLRRLRCRAIGEIVR
ncbi:hypothetical protein SAMN05216406_13510 [Nitrosomonas ureae]|uniref:Uncharacterized protein n=1 Tax=Nitrosomonas ureae TaxID=44577 RepID=A0A1H2GQ19_9PROT|nr:hypothetical protein SAMN05216406_13510 [Nitrosomonas ureae]